MAEEGSLVVHKRVNRKVSSVSACEWDNDGFPMAWDIQYQRGTPLSTVVTTREFLTEFSGTETLVDIQNPHR